jgi:hypothetical protein
MADDLFRLGSVLGEQRASTRDPILTGTPVSIAGSAALGQGGSAALPNLLASHLAAHGPRAARREAPPYSRVYRHLACPPVMLSPGRHKAMQETRSAGSPCRPAPPVSSDGFLMRPGITESAEAAAFPAFSGLASSHEAPLGVYNRKQSCGKSVVILCRGGDALPYLINLSRS